MLSIAQCLLERHEVFIFWDQKDERAIKDQALYKLGIDIRKAVFVLNIFSKNVSLISRIYSSRQYDSIIYLSDGSIPFVLTKLYIHFQFPTEWVKRSLINSLKLKKVSSVYYNCYCAYPHCLNSRNSKVLCAFGVFCQIFTKTSCMPVNF